MAFPQTPQRPLPGAFFNTPAPNRFPGGPIPRPQFRQQSSQQATQQQPQQSPQARPESQSLQPVQRAARTINEILQKEVNFPDLDSYVRQGISSDYDLPEAHGEYSWAPFHRTKMYDIPDNVFDQWNRAEVSTAMGLFAELNHAWVSIDNALYLWDYTNPNPDIIGFEEQNNSITSVKLVVPRAGVFVKTITHLLVVATTAEMILLGIESSTGPTGVRTISLYNTRMSLSIRGTNVQIIEGSDATGRIFFAGDSDTEIYELTYQQEEKWFASRCSKINHTRSGYGSLVPTVFTTKTKENIISMVVDDSRRLLYTLSNQSCIRTYYMDSPSSLQQVIEKKRAECLRDISHMTPASTLLTNSMKIISISPISAREGSKLHLMALTTTGCRLFLSATRGYGYLSGQGAPQSMQVQHIKFPPRTTATPPGQQYTGAAEPPIEISSIALSFSRMGLRYAPGLFLDFVQKAGREGKDALFLSAPDTARISAQAREIAGLASRYYEQGCWIELNSVAEAVGLVTKPFAAAGQPVGFGNELAVQYDEAPQEIAILTNSGVHIIRRRRLVDVFASAIRAGGSEEGFENEVKKFIRQYGRGETTATALAVACGQGNDTSPTAQLKETRIAKINDPETLELARKCFVEFGGRPSMNDNGVPENVAQAIENVRPSSRHEGLALYMGRLVRSLWKASVITIMPEATGGVAITTTVGIEKLKAVQEDMIKLQTFLEKNQSFIEGLAGPESLQRVASKQEELALQGEHQALYSLQKLNTSIIEGISFVQMLFDERVDEIWSTLGDQVKQDFRSLTYEVLFATDQGRDLAKVLVKAIVNRNIANGSNVDTVAEALRRRCGSFCSADDVIIFKAQEQLKKASEVGPKTDMGRNLLNESLRLFLQVAKALSFENLHTATEQFASLGFYAGAISLALLVAQEHDRGNAALAWHNDGQPQDDPRKATFAFRTSCYELVHHVLQMVDQVTSQQPEYIDGRLSISATKRLEAYSVIGESEDELFHYDLYDWYLSQGWTDKLLGTESPFVVTFLTKQAEKDVDRADLLWRYYVFNHDFYNAAQIQYQLAQTDNETFKISLARRIEYLSRAKANANTQSGGIGKQARQILLYSISELLDVANIQDEILHRVRGDERIAPDRKEAAVKLLDGKILSLTDLFNEYSDAGNYYDINLMILEASNHRNTGDIRAVWQYYIEDTHSKVTSDPENATQRPYEAIVNIVREMSNRLNNSELTFSPSLLIPMIETYAFEFQNGVGPQNWVVDLFISVAFPFDAILVALHEIYSGEVSPFSGTNKRVIADHIIHACEQWYQDCIKSNKRLFGSEENAMELTQILHDLSQSGLPQDKVQRANNLIRKVQQSYL